jgi:hypothetical protein
MSIYSNVTPVLSIASLAVLGSIRGLQFSVQGRRGADYGANRRHQAPCPRVSTRSTLCNLG